jgi:hypothetical protein
LAAIILALVIGGQDNVNVKVTSYLSRQGAVIAIAIAIVPPRVEHSLWGQLLWLGAEQSRAQENRK